MRNIPTTTKAQLLKGAREKGDWAIFQGFLRCSVSVLFSMRNIRGVVYTATSLALFMYRNVTYIVFPSITHLPYVYVYEKFRNCKVLYLRNLSMDEL